jgi:predicted  nucleic acid-binding Zn-ribbon protein
VSLFGRKEKEEIARLNAEMQNLREAMPSESHTLDDINREIAASREELEQVEKTLKLRQQELNDAVKELQQAKEQIVETNEEVLMQSFGLYTPRYSFMNSDEYKARLLEIRAEQKDMIKNKTAVTGNSNWTVNNSAAKGKKMVSDMQKLLLRAFNSECDDVIEHVKYNNIEASEKRITTSREAISKLGIIMEVSIQPKYYRLKIEELHLAFEYAQKKQQEKEEQKEARARMREEAKLAKEIEEERKKLEKEQQHYQNALERINAQLAAASEGDRAAIEEKKAELVAQLDKIDKEFKDVDYREANQRAGYVYVISNIGAFGENVYKIGMTRRLDPQDRVDELGDASVPFNFDVHAMIFSDDAPRLEAALHNAFADRKLNFVNQRREFFRVSLDEIKKVVKENYDRSVEFVELAPAEQYRESIKLREEAQKNTSSREE